MTLADLAVLHRDSRLLSGVGPVEQAALCAVPELAEGLPAVTADRRGAWIWSGCEGELAPALDGLRDTLESAAASGGGDPTGEPLVAVLTHLVVAGAQQGGGAAVVPLLEVLRATWRLLAEPPFLGMEPAALANVAAAVQARLAAACVAASERERLPALAWAVARNRLLPVFPRGAMDADADWVRVAAVLGVPFTADTAVAVRAALRMVVSGVTDRRAAGKTTADDALLLARALPAVRLDEGVDAAAAWLFTDPDGVSMALPLVGRLADAKALVAAGVPAAQAAGLATPQGGLAVASVLVELLRAARSWAALAPIVAAVRPAPLVGLGVPRTSSSRLMVVAVGLGRVRADGLGDAGWPALTAALDTGVAVDLGFLGLAAFPDALDALHFALAVRAQIGGAPVAMAWGSVNGGSDGRTVRLFGPAVDVATRWASTATRGGASDGGSHPGLLRSHGGWLSGEGLTLDVSASEALREARERRGLVTAIDGPAGGEARVPRAFDLHRAFELGDKVVALLRIPGVAGGFEVLVRTQAEWHALLDQDGARADSLARPVALASPESLVAPSPAVAVRADAEEGRGWEMEEPEDEGTGERPVTLDLEESTGEMFASEAAQPRFEFEDPDASAEAEAADSGFSGFYLPGATAREEAPVLHDADRSARPSFEMEVEDDEEETAEWEAPTPVANAPSVDKVPPPMLADVFGEPAQVQPDDGPFSVPPELFRASTAPEEADPFGADPFEADVFSLDPIMGEPAAARGTPAADVLFAEPAASDPFSAGTPEGVGFDSRGADPFGADPFAADPFGADPFGADVLTADAPAADPFSAPPPAGDGSGADPFSTDPFSTDPFSTDPFSADPFTADPLADAGPAPVAAAPAAGGDPFAAAPRTPGAPGDDPFAPEGAGPEKAARTVAEEERSDAAFDFEGAASAPGAKGSGTRSRSTGRAGAVDFDFLLKGYACFFDRREAVFGRPYGTRIVDRHMYPYAGDPDETYRAFLQDKIREGFVPRADMMGDLPRGVTLMPLDAEKLRRAWEDLS